MSKTQKVSTYTFRIHVGYAQVPDTIKRIAEASEYLAVYQHDGEGKRTHIHGYMEGYKMSIDSIKGWIKKELGVSEFDPNDWAFPTKITKGPKKGQPVDREALTYFYKGQYPIKFFKGFTIDEISELHSRSYIPDKTRSTHNERTLKKANKCHWDLIEEMKSLIEVEEYLKQDLFGSLVTSWRPRSYDQVYQIMIQTLDKHKLRSSPHDLERWFCTLVRDDESNSLKRNILAKFSR